MKIRRNDEVLMITGKDRGKKGKVHRSFPRERRLLVEGLNMVKRHMRPRGTIRQAGIIEREAPIHVSNVMLVCPRCGRPTRVLRPRPREDRNHPGQKYPGKPIRICRKCKEYIDEV